MEILNNKRLEFINYMKSLTKVDKFIIIMAFVNPFLFILSPFLTLVFMILEIGSVFTLKEKFESKFWKAYLLAATFWGVSICSVKIYDLLVIIFIPITFFAIKKKVSKFRKIHLIGILCFAIYLIFSLFLHKIDSITVAGLIRYLMCFLTLYLFFKTVKSTTEFAKLFPFLRIITIATLITGLLMAVLNRHGIVFQHKNIIYNIFTFNNTDSFREEGFFGDPNKFYSYFTILLAFYEFYTFAYKKEKFKFLDTINSFLIVGILVSFSRTGITAVIAYLIAKLIAIYVLKGKQKANMIFWWVIVALGGVAFILFNKEIMNLLNIWIYNFTKLIGRSHSLIYSSTVTDSSRAISSKLALGTLKGHFIFGRGFDYWERIYYMPSCDSFINVLQDAGIIGLAFFVGLLAYSLRKIPIYIIGLLVIFPLFTMNLQNYTILYLLIGLGIIYLEEYRKLKSINKGESSSEKFCDGEIK
ncbi:MAG: hypothetical protein ACRDD2_07465 [Sarcina sp.]